MYHKPKNNGFTLIEVLVALSILGIALVSTVKVFGSSAKNMIHLKKHQIAYWVGSNYLIQQQIDRTWPELGKIYSKTKMANKEWFLTAETLQSSADKNLREITVKVFNKRNDKDEVVTMTGYKSREIKW